MTEPSEAAKAFAIGRMPHTMNGFMEALDDFAAQLPDWSAGAVDDTFAAQRATDPTPEALATTQMWNASEPKYLIIAFDEFDADAVRDGATVSVGDLTLISTAQLMDLRVRLEKSDAGEPSDPSPGGLEREHNRPPPPASGTVEVVALEWSEPMTPDGAHNHYDWCVAETSFGAFEIEWQSWRDYPSYVLSLRLKTYSTLGGAKRAAQRLVRNARP
jgi:hypothetical protein